MGLALSSNDQRQLTVAIEALLSPLVHDTRENWFGAIAREIRPLIRGDSTLIAFTIGGSSGHFSPDAPELASRVTEATAFRMGELHFSDPVMEEGLVTRRKRALQVFTSAILNVISGNQLRKSFFYNDVCRPFGARITYGLGMVGSEGEALFGVNAERSRRDPLSEDTLALLALLAPAFQAGFEMLARLEHAHRALSTTLDMLSQGMLVYDAITGRELHRNPALRTLRFHDPEFDVVEQRARALARALYRVHRSGARGQAGQSGDEALPELGDLRTAGGRYSLRASFLPAAIYTREQVVLVSVEHHGIALPGAVVLRERFGLTAREAQVALRLAQGDSDAELAVTLGVSSHTVRHHTERVFEKLHVHSRKALALWLATMV
jgi:DNA-binding CsgD family transcriptional regulator